MKAEIDLVHGSHRVARNLNLLKRPQTLPRAKEGQCRRMRERSEVMRIVWNLVFKRSRMVRNAKGCKVWDPVEGT